MFFVWEHQGGITQLITFLNVIKHLVTLSLWERLFHKWAPLQQILRLRNSVRSLSRANLFVLSLRSYSLVNGLNRSCKYSGVRLIKTLKISLAFCFSFWYRGYPILNLCGGRQHYSTTDFVVTLMAQFCQFCSFCNLSANSLLRPSQTRQQQSKCGSIRALYSRCTA